MTNTAHGAGVTRGQYSFANIPSVEIPRSQFDRSSGLKTAFNAGFIVPIFVDEALPGDTMNLRAAAYARMATPIYPILDNVFMDFFYFAVPVRLLWDNWKKFNGEQVDPGDPTDYLIPTMTETVADDSLSDFMGIPTGITDLEFNSLHHRAYNLIFNEWFRDENLQDSLVVDTDDGPDDPADYELIKRGKRHDYFTSCLPFTQKGSAVELPLGTTAPVISTGDGMPLFSIDGTDGFNLKGGPTPATNTYWDAAPTLADDATWDETKLAADLDAAEGATINTIRQAFQIQRMLERDARGGSRYTEILRSHFGVVSPDARLQRPEYLGGGTSRINVNPVAQAIDGGAADPLGKLAAFASTASAGIGFVKSFTEHCVILGFANVRADITYQHGLNRMFSRQTRYDFYWPALAHLGEQAVLNKEIYAQGDENDDLVWGFQERFAEYRYKPSLVTGMMRSEHATPLDAWHLALDFEALPTLNDVFIEDNPPFSRINAVATDPDFVADFYFDYKCVRPMPTFSVPGLVDHF